jgi:predicted extracellular nuclease
MGLRVRLVAVAAAVAACFTPLHENISAQSGPSVLISEFRFSGPNGVNDEFIELFNAGSSPVSVGGWTLRSSNNFKPPTVALRATIPAGTTINSGCYYLVAFGTAGVLVHGVKADLNYTIGIADDGGVGLTTTSATTIVDQVGFGVNSAFAEGTRLTVPPASTVNRSFERVADPTFGYRDTNDNATDFALISPSRPQNSASACVNFKVYLPHEIQGAGSVSPLTTGTIVNVRGVVTARKADGFFMQTEPGSEDGDANTSEGVFVSYAGAVTVGNVVKVLGRVSEFAPDANSATVTRVDTVSSVTDLGAGSLPDAHLLSTSDLSDAGSLDQLERFEGMRVKAEWLTAVSATRADGSFFAVLTGQTRPFREPGVLAGSPVIGCALSPCNVPVFDGNPERLRVDSDGLLGHSQVLVSTGATMNAVTGPLDFAARAYTLLPESLAPVGGMSIVGASAAAANQFTLASLNLGAFHATRLAKASQAVRDVMSSPDVVGVQGVDTYGALSDLAEQINTDAGTTVYEAFPLGNAADPLGIGFLLKVGRVSAINHELVGADVNDRPSIALFAHVQGPSTSLPQDLTVIVNQLQSLTDVERDDAAGAAVRARRKDQAEALATYIQGRQSSAPNEVIVSLGDYNAFDFNDGYVDVVGTVRGLPAPEDQVALASLALVSPALVDADGFSQAAERYSSLSDGNAQSLDHVLFSASVSGQFVALAHVRVNADFPDAARDDTTTAMRLSDRDPLVAFFTFPPDVEAPVIDAVDNVVAEATGPDGAVVTFNTPSAQDNLDPSVTVNCLPASGNTFAVGNTGVICSAQDVAGNPASVSFTVTVQDTIAPVLSVPADQVAEATSAAGAVVTFSASATDAVTTTLNVVCSPSSGSTFALGTTQVNCSTYDAAGNGAFGSFNITVRDTTAPVLLLPANITAEATSAAGRAVSFTASATDAVTASPAVTCTPASGSTFAVGTTQVNCAASDAAGNTAKGSFTVTITPPPSTSGHMYGDGDVGNGNKRVTFAFNVREVTNVDPGSAAFAFRDGQQGGPDRFSSTRLDEVRFSSSTGGAIDTVLVRGAGNWNGVAEYRFEMTAGDRGEPGRGLDTLAVTVFAPGGALVATASGTLHNGSIVVDAATVTALQRKPGAGRPPR